MRNDEGKLCALVGSRSRYATARMKPTYGFFSFTEVTDPAEHRSYNEWHQLDHLPEQFPLAGIVYGQRWVSTPACRAARAVSEPDLDPIHYVTCYLMAEPIEPTLDDFFALGAELHRLDRFHQHRQRAPHRAVPRREHRRPRPACSCRPRRVPFRAHRGIYVVVEEPSGADRREPDAGPRSRQALCEVPGVAGVWTFATAPGLRVAALDRGLAPDHRVLARRRSARRRRAARAAGRGAWRERAGAADGDDVRGTVRDDHTVEVGLVRSGSSRGRQHRARSPTRTSTASASRERQLHDVAHERRGHAATPRGIRNAAVITPPWIATSHVSRSVGAARRHGRPSTVYQGKHVAAERRATRRCRRRRRAPGSGWLRARRRSEHATTTTASASVDEVSDADVLAGREHVGSRRSGMFQIESRVMTPLFAFVERMHHARHEQHQRARRRAAAPRRSASSARWPSAHPGPTQERAAARDPIGDLHEHRAGEPPTGAHVRSRCVQQHRDEQAESDERVVVAAVHDRARDDGMQADERERAACCASSAR